MSRPPAKSSEGEKELEKAEKQFEAFDNHVKTLTMDAMNKAPLQETEPQTKIANKDLDKQKEIWLKPFRTISSRERFNDKWKEQYLFAKEYVHFTAENKEIVGETLDFWTKPFPGVPAEEWKVPVNVPVWGPRYVAEQIRNCKYHIFTMDAEKVSGQNALGYDTGQIAVEKTVHRLNAEPVTTRRSVFMGVTEFK
jgi:hypothetical protein